MTGAGHTTDSPFAAFVGRRGRTFTSRDPVNLPAIRRWCDAIGDRNPVYVDAIAAEAAGHTEIIAPPAMLAAWTMTEYGAAPPENDAVAELYAACDAAGYTSIVATNSEQEYLRPLRLGDVVSTTKEIESISTEKSTAIGSGVFISTRIDVTDQYGELVGKQLHRVLKHRPRDDPGDGDPASAPGGTANEPPLRPRPVMTKDTAFFWEGMRQHRLLVQRCTDCGTLRHPPTASCANCGSLQSDSVESEGRGRLFSYTIVHAPLVSPFTPPHIVALVELETGTRLVSELVDVEPAQVAIGMGLTLEWLVADDQLTLPVFRPLRDPGRRAELGEQLPTLRVPLTRSLIVAAAIASGDFQPLHHDPSVARAAGMPDVFTSIHTSGGFVSRFITDWAGPRASVRSIALRLGTLNVAGDVLELTGSVVRVDGDDVEVALVGRNRQGDHVTGSALVAIPAATPDA